MARLWSRKTGKHGKLVTVVLPRMLHWIEGLFAGSGTHIHHTADLLQKIAFLNDPAQFRLNAGLSDEDDVVVENVGPIQILRAFQEHAILPPAHRSHERLRRRFRDASLAVAPRIASLYNAGHADCRGGTPMKLRRAVLTGIAITVAVAPAMADKPLKDYSFIRGVNYGLTADPAILERDLGFAKRINLNSTRIWLNYQAYEREPQVYLDRLRNFIRTSHRLGFSTMPILWNGNSLNPDILKPEFHPRGDAYVKAIVEAVKDEPGLLMWDIMNEPFTNDYYDRAPAEVKNKREGEITAFVRYYLTNVQKVDPVNATTVGYTFSRQLEPTADLVDVLTFHDYTNTRASVEDVYRIAEEVSRKFGKPMMNSETGCIARGNPYDMVLQIAEEHHTGWYLFNLIIQGYWGEIHGLFYPDGTVRDHRGCNGLLQKPRYEQDDPARSEPGRRGRPGREGDRGRIERYPERLQGRKNADRQNSGCRRASG